MKLLIYLEDEDFVGTWRDVYIDENRIDAFYLPDLEDDGIRTINLFLNGQIITVVQNDEILNYLTKRFIK